jgi:hypothetical protein
MVVPIRIALVLCSKYNGSTMLGIMMMLLLMYLLLCVRTHHSNDTNELDATVYITRINLPTKI